MGIIQKNIFACLFSVIISQVYPVMIKYVIRQVMRLMSYIFIENMRTWTESSIGPQVLFFRPGPYIFYKYTWLNHYYVV